MSVISLPASRNLAFNKSTSYKQEGLLVTRLKKQPPPSRDRCSNTPVALTIVFCVVSQTIAATPPLLSLLKVAHRNPKTDLTRGVIAEEAGAPEAHRARRGRRTK